MTNKKQIVNSLHFGFLDQANIEKRKIYANYLRYHWGHSTAHINDGF